MSDQVKTVKQMLEAAVKTLGRQELALYMNISLRSLDEWRQKGPPKPVFAWMRAYEVVDHSPSLIEQIQKLEEKVQRLNDLYTREREQREIFQSLIKEQLSKSQAVNSTRSSSVYDENDGFLD